MIHCKIKELIKLFENPQVFGDVEKEVFSISSLSDAKETDLSFLGNSKYSSEVPNTNAGAVLLPLDYQGELPENACIIKVKNPSTELAKVCGLIESILWKKPKPSIHKTAVVDSSSKIHKTATIGPNVVVAHDAIIGENVYVQANNYIGIGVKIGKDSIIMPNAVVMDYCEVGERVRIQSGAVIGSDGYGYEYKDGQHIRVPQVGKVILEDDVDIGANTTIDRARFDKTIIGQGTKIDNLVQIAHNVKIGKGCLIVSQTGISGSTQLGNYCILGGQVGVVGHVKIGDGAKIGAQSGVNGNVDANSYIRGTPPSPFMTAHKLDILKTKLPDLFDRVKTLEKIQGIENKTFLKK